MVRRKVAVTIAVLVCMALAGCGVQEEKPDISSVSTHVSAVSRIEETKAPESTLSDLTWYDSLDEAMWDDSMINNEGGYVPYGELGNQLMVVENEGNVKAFYGIDGVENEYLYFDLVEKDGKYSEPQMLTRSTCETDNGYSMDLRNTVANQILTLYAYASMPIKDNGIPVYWGFWKNEKALQNLTILGEPVDGVMKISDNSPYYFWKLKTDKVEKVLDKEDLSSMTYDQVADLLQINT